MNLKTSFYKNSILSIHRGRAFGVPSNAKPLFLLSIIRGIEEGVIIGNKFSYEGKLESIYNELCSISHSITLSESIIMVSNGREVRFLNIHGIPPRLNLLRRTLNMRFLTMVFGIFCKTNPSGTSLGS